MNHIGTHLKQFRKNRKITAIDMAKTLGITRQHLYRTEAGKGVSVELMERIAKAIGMTVVVVRRRTA